MANADSLSCRLAVYAACAMFKYLRRASCMTVAFRTNGNKKSKPGSVEALKANRGEMEALGVDVMMPSTYGSSSVSR